MGATQKLLRFGVFELNLEAEELRKDGTPIKLPPQPVKVLALLASRAGQLVTRDEIQKEVWGEETYVDFEHGLNQCIKQIRTALNDNADKPLYVETVPRRGYRFLAPVVSKIIAAPAPRVTESKSGIVNRVDVFPIAQDVDPPLEIGSGGTDSDVAGNHAPSQVKPNGLAMPVALAPALNTVTDDTFDSSVETRPSAKRPQEFSTSRPSNRRARRLMMSAALGFVIVSAIAGAIWRVRSTNSPTTRNTSIAVLPFMDLSPTKDQEYFSDGLTEDLINDLAKIPGLKVIARSSAFQFKGKNEDVRVVGQKLKVANILEGSIRRDGDRIRITTELTKTSDGFQLWSEKYDPEMKDIIAVQDEIARAVTTVLQMKLMGTGTTPTATDQRTANPEAYQAYLQARYFFGQSEVEKALTYADKAIQLDPRYAAAWALRSMVMQVGANGGFVDSAGGYRRARDDARQAIALDPNLSDGFLALGQYQIDHEWNWAAGEQSLKQASQLQPGSADVIGLRAFLSRTMGDLNEAISLQEQLIALDPLNVGSYRVLGFSLYAAGRYDDALAAARKALEINPQTGKAHSQAAEILLAQGKLQQALAETAQEPLEWATLTDEAIVYHALGRQHDSDVTLAKLIVRHQEQGAFQIALVYSYRKELDKAFAWLDRAYQQRDAAMVVLKVHPLLENLRPDPRYKELLRKMNLPL